MSSATEIKWCRACVMPSSRPRVVFDETGQCNACKWIGSEYLQTDWDARRKEFERIVDQNRRNQTYDCIVPMSGGKDSAVIAWRLKHEYGLNPLCVTYGQMLWTEAGRWNFDQVSRAGIETLYWRHNQDVSRRLARRFHIERGHIKQHYDSGVNAAPLVAAIAFNIPLVFYAEHGESFYSGLVLNEESRRTRDIVEVLEHQVGDDARNWAVDGISDRDLHLYVYPSVDKIKALNIQAFYFSYFRKWDVYENAQFARERMNFQQARNGATNDTLPLWWGKSDGSFEGFDSLDDMVDDVDFFMMGVKFGFGRAARMASRLIQMGHMTRERGLELVHKYDIEPPKTYLREILDYIDMTEDEFWCSVDVHRNPEIWERVQADYGEEDDIGGEKWKLRFPPR